MPMQDGLHVRGVHIPDAELDWRFVTSGGPGGQHANRSNTAVELRFDIGASQALPDRLKERLTRRLADRLTTSGEGIVQVAETRSQTRNRQVALTRLRDLLVEATSPPAKPRRPTKPSRRARQRRLDNKKRRGELKRTRQEPDWR